MKKVTYILLLLVLSVGLITALHGVQPNSLQGENLTETTIEPAISSCSFIAATNEYLPVEPHSYYNDENNGSWTNIALCPNNLHANNTVSSKIFKVRLHLPGGLLQQICPARLLTKQKSLLAFNPNALRYSHGYYIYALAHILI